MSSLAGAASPRNITIPSRRDNFYAGGWHAPATGAYAETFNPGTGESLGRVAESSSSDVDRAVEAARTAFPGWRDTPPAQRAQMLRALAQIVRDNAEELALLDAANSGNPVRETGQDIASAAAQLDFFAGLVTEMKGASIPMGPGSINFSIREPRGVVARILPFNHPFMFCVGKAAAPLAAGNTVVVKPPDQAPLSALRFFELAGAVLPSGVLNAVVGGREVGAALAAHPGIDMTALIGSVNAGRAVMRAAADKLNPVLLELGGKNALIGFPDADPDELADAVVKGMNFGWCGQSCGSTSRAFLHADIHDAVLERAVDRIAAFVPGVPTNEATTMGALASKDQLERTLRYIAMGIEDGARLVTGGERPVNSELADGNFVQPTVFADVTPQMRIAREEIFGPVLSVLKWDDFDTMIAQVNGVEYGLTCSIWTQNIDHALHAAGLVDAGFVWINEVGKHFLGAPFGGVKSSGLGREECLEELLAFTREKNIHIRRNQRSARPMART